MRDFPKYALQSYTLPLLYEFSRVKKGTNMISIKRLTEMARKWQRMAGIERRAIPMPRKRHKVANKGHFVVYTVDKRRFVIPLAYLRSKILRELFRMSEDEFGLPTDGPITLPCDAAFMEYVVSLLQNAASWELEKDVLVASLASCHTPIPLSTSHGFPSCPITIGGGP